MNTFVNVHLMYPRPLPFQISKYANVLYGIWRALDSCVCCRGCSVCNKAQCECRPGCLVCNVVNTTSPPTPTQDYLVDFVVNMDGMLIAVYNDDQTAVIKLKDVSTDQYADWHLTIRPQVRLPLRSRL